jgi:Uma2 family endonuclease
MATVTEDQVEAGVPVVQLPDFYEVVFGRVIERPPMSILSTRTANRIKDALSVFLHEHDVGKAEPDMLFRLPLAEDRERNRRPDVAYVSYVRWAKDRPVPEDGNAWDVVPDLAVEVVSPTDFAEDLLAKVGEYFRAGVRLVWVVYPRERLVCVYRSLTDSRGLTRDDTLDGGDVLPGFRVPLADVLQAPQAPA